MTSQTLRTTAIVSAAAGFIVASVGTASAQTVHDKDTRGDVVQVAATGEDATPAPDQVNGDITRTRFRYGSKVGVVAHFADLRRVGDLRGDFLQVATNEGMKRQVVLLSQSGDWAGSTSLTKLAGDEVACHGITHAVDYRSNTVRIEVPRSCLSNPRWVKLGFGSGMVMDIAKGTETFDDALQHGPVDSSATSLMMSTRMHRAR